MFPPWVPVRAAQFFFLIIILQTPLFRSVVHSFEEKSQPCFGNKNMSGLLSFQLWIPGEIVGGAGWSMLWWLLSSP